MASPASRKAGGSNTGNLLATGILIVGAYLYYRSTSTKHALTEDFEKSPFTRYRTDMSTRVDQKLLKEALALDAEGEAAPAGKQ